MKPSSDNKITLIRGILSGTMAGLIAMLVMLIFVNIYRTTMNVDAYYMAISPLVIIVAIPILLAIFGMLLSVLSMYVSKGITWFTLLFLLLTVFGVIMDAVHPQQGPLFTGSKGLLFGVEVITGLAAALLIPYLAQHPGIFMNKLGEKASE